MQPGGDGGQGMNWILARVMGAAIASLVMAVVIGIILYAPKPYPSIKPIIKADAKKADGFLQTYYLLGLLKGEWTHQNGLPEGVAFHFYPNGSVMHRMFYVQGHLDGLIQEFYEKPGSARGVSRRHIPKNPPQAKIGVGPLKAEWQYVMGVREGAFKLYYNRGAIKQEGSYHQNKLHGFVRRYKKNGALKSEALYQNGKKMSGKKANLVIDTQFVR